MTKSEAEDIALTILVSLTPLDGDADTYSPDPNDVVAAVRDIVRDHAKVRAALAEYDDGPAVLRGLGLHAAVSRECGTAPSA